MNIFLIYDLVFMVLFTLAVVFFTYKNKHKMHRESGMYLYKAQWGVNLIEKIAKKYRKILLGLQGIVITLGYILMGSIILMMSYSAYLYLTRPEITQMVKAPPVIPLIPYFTDIFNVQSLFPSSLTFTYFIVALIIVAVVHEFSHGIFMRLHKIKIKSTGFAFFGPLIAEAIREWVVKTNKRKLTATFFSILIVLLAIYFKSPLVLIILVVPLLGAFVEQDDKQMNKAKKIPQLAILSAGVFANIVFALIFLILIWGFFAIAFAPAGILFNDYAFDIVQRTDIISIDNLSLQNGLPELNYSKDYVALQTGNKTFFAPPLLVKKAFDAQAQHMLVYRDSPAFNAKLSGVITHVNGKSVSSYSEFSELLSKSKPGDVAEIKTKIGEEVITKNIVLGSNEGRAFVGITVPDPSRVEKFVGFLYSFTPKMNNALTGIHYESRLGDLGTYFFHMFWWVMTINFFVALFNMLPLWILDGGRFFYLTVAGITKSEKIGAIAFKIATWIILLLVLLMMLGWTISL
ncbi:hypothetical protein FJZ18_00850 [Candidatus Pacearchaeota archaeon]|nr:hypothetical protein [Candidatus Pacearchaeota archaeon]